MQSAAHRALGVRCHRLGTGLAVLAVFGQLMLGTVVPRQAVPSIAALFPWTNAICHGTGSTSSAPVKHHRSLPGWVVCPFCLALSVPLPTPSEPAVAWRPAVVLVPWRTLLPPARAPPVRPPRSVQPRGPPALI